MKRFHLPLFFLLLLASNTFAYNCDVDGDGREGLAEAIHALRVVAGMSYEDTSQLCNDGIDNDGDGHIDCADDECSGMTCDDGDSCTTTDICAAGTCVGGPALNCDDGNQCTDDACDAAIGCINIDNTDACDDGDPSTINDTCQSGVCVGQQSTCDDSTLNGDETDIDCGGSCSPCTVGNDCSLNTDCLSNVCDGGVCQ